MFFCVINQFNIDYINIHNYWNQLTFLDILNIPLFSREADEGCKKPMERLLTIWQERSLYRADFIQQLKLAIEDSNSPKQKSVGTDG